MPYIRLAIFTLVKGVVRIVNKSVTATFAVFFNGMGSLAIFIKSFAS
ncbi:MAG: hypothetical protein IKS96_00430 [Fibrobacter sp.]|nr:hypothetical protein [Fibrobacter sp.]